MIRQFKVTVSIKEVRADAPDVDIASAHVSHYIDERAFLAARWPIDYLRYEIARALEHPTKKLADAAHEHLDKEIPF